ncbi:MAG: hypothetical protein WAW85_03625 [Gordonia sp. (in: high G+C Gram-positive bacteria)]|uniref:hypothetical protein n=1 Tax=Gordonia sp. (in: high G+C Gram-positive bacteria) TaxID=84139 RepID=UPI003BB788D4
MGVSITSLELEGFDRLPLHTRRCVFWEVDPDGSADVLDDAFSGSLGGCESEFDKEAWVSGLMLEWGSCSQIAIEPSTERIVGSAFYAPPNRVPRRKRFPSGPVAADAVLLTKITVEPGFDAAAPLLLDAVIADVIRRGMRAIETFGYTATGDELAGDLVTLLLGGGVAGNVCAECILPTEFLLESGFEVVSADQYLPRLRLDLAGDLGWKQQVEHALSKLVIAESVVLQGSC